MENILIFNAMYPETGHATELALLLAGTSNARLYIWNTTDSTEKFIMEELIVAGSNYFL